MIDLSNIQARDPQRAEHERLMAEFLARGGEVTVLSHVERAPLKPVTFNGSVTPHQQNRKEYLRIERQIAEEGRELAIQGHSVEEALRQMKKKWKAHLNLTAPKLECLAARFGYAYSSTGRGRA